MKRKYTNECVCESSERGETKRATGDQRGPRTNVFVEIIRENGPKLTTRSDFQRLRLHSPHGCFPRNGLATPGQVD